MNKFRGYEVVVPKFKSWDKGIRVKINEKYSLYNSAKPGSWFWREDSPYWKVCLTGEIENQFYSNSSFTNDMSWVEALEFANRMFNKIK